MTAFRQYLDEAINRAVRPRGLRSNAQAIATEGLALRRLHFSWLAIFATLLLFGSTVHAQLASANSVGFQGVLTGTNGQPLPNGNYDLYFRFYTNAVGGVAIGTTNVTSVAVANGIASSAIPVQAAWFDGNTRYLAIAVNGGNELAPRILVTAVPYALRALTASDSQGDLRLQQSLYWGLGRGSGAVLQGDQGGSIELGNSMQVGARPYIDFHHGVGTEQDFNVRFINDADGLLTVYGLSPIRMQVRGTVETTVLQITSDRAAKQAFRPVSAEAILAKVAALPISTWAYTNNPTVRHIGPVAQDFAAAFTVGEDDKHIATVDADGVDLAAIQGLNEKLEEQLRAKDKKIESLENRLAELESLISALARRSPLSEK